MAHTRPLAAGRPIPYDLFDPHHTELEARRARHLSGMYHHGQAKIWDGKQLMAELVERHGGVSVPSPRREALGEILGVILWGEYAAWRVAAELADRLNTVESRMAATSQAHDEARHFYVLYDYLEALGVKPHPPGRWARRLIEMPLRTDDVNRKLLGMQLLVEMIALSLFRNLREAELCPVLTGLLPYFEQDEARHVGLGTQLLPETLAEASAAYKAAFDLYLVRLATAALMELREMAPTLRLLGIDPGDIVRVVKERSFDVGRQSRDAGGEDRAADLPNAFIDTVAEAWFPAWAPDASPAGRLAGLGAAFRNGIKAPTARRPPPTRAA